jgi:hypothetical protein
MLVAKALCWFCRDVAQIILLLRRSWTVFQAVNFIITPFLLSSGTVSEITTVGPLSSLFTAEIDLQKLEIYFTAFLGNFY